MAVVEYTHGNLKTESLPGNKFKRTLAPFGVLDDQGNTWFVPEGTITDGKSLPPGFKYLPTVGDPFAGDTEEAAIIHDHYCRTKERSQKDTHKIFRELCEHEGVWGPLAWQMWLAVRIWNRANPKNKGWK